MFLSQQIIFNQEAVRGILAAFSGLLFTALGGVTIFLHIKTAPEFLTFLRFPRIAFGLNSTAQLQSPLGFLTYLVVLIILGASLFFNVVALLFIQSSVIRSIGMMSGVSGFFAAVFALIAIVVFRKYFFAVPPSFFIFLGTVVLIGIIALLTFLLMISFENNT